LRRIHRENDPRRRRDCTRQLIFDVRLGYLGAPIRARSYVRTLQETDIHVRRRLTQEFLEERRLTAVTLEIRCIEESAPIRFGDQRVRIECAVIVKKRSEGEQLDREWQAVSQEAGWHELDAGREEGCLRQNAIGSLADVSTGSVPLRRRSCVS